MLKQANFLEVTKIEAQMTELKNKELNYLRSPNAFYCTFERERSFINCLENASKFKFDF